MAEAPKRSLTSSDAVSRSSSIAERKNLKKRRKWLKGLTIVSSEEDSDYSRSESTVGTSQIIALRFPYPMLSDDSDDEEDLKFFPNDCSNTTVHTQEKRKHISSSDEHTSHKHKKRIKKLDYGNKNSSDDQNKEAKLDYVKNNYRQKHSTFSDKENLKYDSPRKQVKLKSYCRIISSPCSTSSDEDYNYNENRTADMKETEKVFNHTSSTNLSSRKSSKTLNHVKVQSRQSTKNKSDHIKSSIAVKSKQKDVNEDKSISDAVSIPQVCPEGNNRFLDSSSCESVGEQKKTVCDKQKSFQTRSGRNMRYRRRIHELSTSSSCSDNDEAVNNQNQHNLANSRVVRSSSGYNKSNHSISTSNDEDDTHLTIINENLNKNNETKIGLPQATGIKHPCYNLLKNFNSTEPQQSGKNKKEKTDANKANKNFSEIISTKKPNTSKSEMSNLNSSAWTNVGNVSMKKSEYKSSKHQLKLNDLKKKFVSSNVSSIEVHKQVQNKLSVNKNNNQSTLGPKDLNKVLSSSPANVEVNSNDIIADCKVNENKSTTVHNSGEVRQPIENKYTVNVNVFCSSPQTSEYEGTEEREDYARATGDQIRTSDQTKLDINLSVHDDEGENIISEHSKKTRISHIYKQSNKPIINSKKSLKLKSNRTSKPNTTKQDESDAKSEFKDCDVLGNILSEMENNPYKTERHIKKAKDPIPNLLNWSPNPILFPNNTQTYNSAINSNIGIQGFVQPNLVSPFNTNNAASSCATTSTSAVLPSGLDYIDRKNKSGEDQKAFPRDSRENKKSVTMKFYSANSTEYISTEGVSRSPFEQNGLENSISCKVQTPNNNSAENAEDAKANKILVDGTPNEDETNKTQCKGKENIEWFKTKDPQEGSLTKHLVEEPTEVETNSKIMDGINTDNENTKGIRIKFGGTIFRLPTISSSENNMSAFKSLTTNTLNKDNITQSNYVHSNNIDNSALTTSHAPSTDLSNPAISSQGKDPDASHSEDSDTSSDSNDSDDSSSASSDSAGSMQEGSRLTERGNNIATNQICSTEKDDSLKNQTSFDSALGNLSNSHDLVTKGPKGLKSVMCDNNDDNVIVLSDSPDSESSSSRHEEYFKVEDIPTNIDTRVPLSNVSDGSNNTDSVNFVGKIRVKSLRDLGVGEEMVRLSENALPPSPNVSPQVMSSGQQNLLSTLNTSKPPPYYGTHQIQPGQQSNFNGQLNLQTESTTNSKKVVLAVTHQMLKSNKKINSIISESKGKQYQQNCLNNTPSTNQSAVLTEAEVNTSKKQEVRSLQTINEVNGSTQTVLQKERINSVLYTLFNNLFTEVVQLKIPKLVDDMHLAIIHDKLKEERLKKLDQLISPETIASERRRAEKDFNDAIRIRGQSFVPLFMTIVNKISKGSFKTLIIAIYCVIIHQLERIDPANARYRIKLKDIIKCMLQKYNSPVTEQVFAVFNSDNFTFVGYFNYVEKLVLEYNKTLEENNRKSLQNEHEINTPSSSTGSEIVNSSEQMRVNTGSSSNSANAASIHLPVGLILPVSAAPTTSVIVAVIEQPEPQTQQILSNQNQPKLPGLRNIKPMPSSTSSQSCPPKYLIGNLDELLFKKNSPDKSKTTR